MARLTKEQWEDLEAKYHTGQFSKNQLAEEFELSHTAVNKRLKGIDPKHKEKVSTLITTTKALYEESYNTEKEVSAVETFVEEKTKHLKYFMDSALKNQFKANKLLEETESIRDVEAHSRITKNNKETVLGKDPEYVINNSNSQNNVSLTWDLLE